MFFLSAFVRTSINHSSHREASQAGEAAVTPLLMSDELKAKSRPTVRSIYLGVIDFFTYCAGDGNQASCVMVGERSPTELHPTVTCGF